MSAGGRRVSAVVLLVACSGANAGQSGPQGCSPVEAPATSVAADGLEGGYTVRLVSTAGEKRGAAVEGRLELMAQEGAYRSMERTEGVADTTFRFPLYGTAEVDFAAVGASVPGDPGASDPLAPGVLVIERPGGVMLRLGSEANRRGVRRFDGGYTVLQVEQVTDRGFAGTWRSAVGLEQSGGHFCAVETG